MSHPFAGISNNFIIVLNDLINVYGVQIFMVYVYINDRQDKQADRGVATRNKIKCN
jgi:hypothetical protein